MSSPVGNEHAAGLTGRHGSTHPIAVLWDQSLIWGLICIETLEAFAVPYRLLSGGEIAEGALDGYHVLLVPGGWASHKVGVLGVEGAERVRQFIEDGGAFLGFCGGAGLALSSPPSLNLVPLKRLPLSKRLPSASGELWITGVPDHEVWKDLPLHIPVSVWWPSQFAFEPCDSIASIATYSATGKDFWVADLSTADVKRASLDMGDWERTYGINLDPLRILGHPAILEARRGRGVLILSYPHLETPGDFWGNRLFLNVLNYLDRISSRDVHHNTLKRDGTVESPMRPTRQCLSPLARSMEHIDDLIRFGERHLLWNWRSPWLLRWRRGIRGLEYGTLAVVGDFLLRQFRELAVDEDRADSWLETVEDIEKHTDEFCRQARLLLLEEKLSAQSGNLTKLGSINERVDALRTFLFGDQMNHSGLCRSLFDKLDSLLFRSLRLQQDMGLKVPATKPN